MPGIIPQTFIDDLMARVDIVDLIDSKVPLKRSGRSYVARCPFHQEKTPSFHVDRDKQLYHCFGCGAGGTSIGFVMDYHHLSFVEAVEDLAKFVGIEVPRINSDTSSADVLQLDALYDLHKQAAEFYAAKLFDPGIGRDAVSYLKKRGVKGETARKFLLGFAPPGFHVLRERFSDQALRDTGLLVSKENGQSYDRFRNRVMVPIRDRRGRVVGFGARVLDDSVPKYLNSPETPIFQKKKQLYGLYELLSDQPHPERILVVEGYMDVIMLVQNGVRNAVATLGTALSRNHLDTLFRHSGELIFCFDGDQAGKQAAWRAVEIALPVLREGRTLRILLLPEGHDPDSLIRRDGQAAFEQAMATSSLLSDYFFDYLSAGLNLTELEGCANLVAKARPLIGQLAPGVFRDMIEARLRELARLENVQLDHRKSVFRNKPVAKPVREPKSSAIRSAIALLIQHPDLAGLIDTADPRWHATASAGVRLLFKTARLIREEPRINPAALLERFRGTEHEATLTKLAQSRLIVPEKGIEAEFNGALARILEQENAKRIEYLLEKNDQAPLTREEREELRRLLPPRPLENRNP
ncbi:MAG: DNA primase [Methylococcales bacterium]